MPSAAAAATAAAALYALCTPPPGRAISTPASSTCNAESEGGCKRTARWSGSGERHEQAVLRDRPRWAMVRISYRSGSPHSGQVSGSASGRSWSGAGGGTTENPTGERART